MLTLAPPPLLLCALLGSWADKGRGVLGLRWGKGRGVLGLRGRGSPGVLGLRGRGSPGVQAQGESGANACARPGGGRSAPAPWGWPQCPSGPLPPSGAPAAPCPAQLPSRIKRTAARGAGRTRPVPLGIIHHQYHSELRSG